MSPEARRNISESLKAQWASGARKPIPKEARERATETLKRRYRTGELIRKYYPRSDGEKMRVAKKLSEMHKGKVLRKSPIRENEKKRFKAVSDNFRSRDPRGKKGPENQSAYAWKLQSPMGKIYKFRNLSHFVRENGGLFDLDDVAWRQKKNSPSHMECRAVWGLSSISPRRKRCRETWKGWRWHIDGHHHDTLISVLP